MHISSPVFYRRCIVGSGYPSGRLSFPRSVRPSNTAIILEIIRQNPRVSRKELSQITGLSPALVTKICADLLNREMIREVGIGHSSGGRRPIYIELNHEAFYLMCFYIQDTGVSFAVCDCCGNIILYRKLRDAQRRLTGSAAICRQVRDCLASYEAAYSAVGIAVADSLYTSDLEEALREALADRPLPLLILRSSFAALRGMDDQLSSRYANRAYIHIGPSVYGGILHQDSFLGGSHNRVGCTWDVLEPVRCLQRELSRQDPDSERCVGWILQTSHEIARLFDPEIMVLDLFHESVSSRLRQMTKAHILRETDMDFSILQFPTIFFRGLANILASRIRRESESEGEVL